MAENKSMESRSADTEYSPAPVWFATTSVNNNTTKPLFPVGWHESQPEKEALDHESRRALNQRIRTVCLDFRAGKFVDPDFIGGTFVMVPGFKKPSGPHPFMKLSAYYVVTAEVRSLLERLDPGPLHFHAIEALKLNREGPVWEGADLHVMQVLTCRREVVVEDSRGLDFSIGKLADGTDILPPGERELHGSLVVTPPAAGSAEMWLNDQLDGSLFLSDRIVSELKAAKLTRGWGLKRCTVKTLH